MANSGGSTDSDKPIAKEVYSAFIGILFAIVIGYWFTVVFNNKSEHDYFTLGTFILLYILIASSYVSLHNLIKHGGYVRQFIVSNVLLFLYYIAFVYMDNFDRILWIMFSCFVCYTIWAAIDYCHDPENKTGSWWPKLKIHFLFAGISALVATAYYFIHPCAPNTDCLFLILAFIYLIIYRIRTWPKSKVEDKNVQISHSPTIETQMSTFNTHFRDVQTSINETIFTLSRENNELRQQLETLQAQVKEHIAEKHTQPDSKESCNSQE